MSGRGLLIQPHGPGLREEWDRLTTRAGGGTLLHSRRFLDYHGSRFRELSLVARKGQGGPLVALLPMAADLNDPALAVSHPGSSFGGVVAASGDPALARAMLRQAALWLRDQGFDRLLYRAPPAAVLRQPDDGLLPDLIRLGRITQYDLWSLLALPAAPQDRAYAQSEQRRGARKGLVAHPIATPGDWAVLHDLLSARLLSKYGKRPVHSLAELIDLSARLGPQSRAQIIRDAEGRALAAQWFIDYGTGTLHNQYNAATDAGLALGAASFGIATALESASTEGFRAFSFGRSTNDDGFTENGALVRFKAGFGAGLSGQMHILLPLDALATLRE